MFLMRIYSNSQAFFVCLIFELLGSSKDYKLHFFKTVKYIQSFTTYSSDVKFKTKPALYMLSFPCLAPDLDV